MPPSSSKQQQQTQQPQQQQPVPSPPSNGTTTNNNNNPAAAATTTTTTTTPLSEPFMMPPRPLSQKEQEQTRPPSAVLRTLPPMAAPPPPAPAGSPTPLSLLQHPSLLPLRVQTGADGRRSVVLPDGTPLLDGLSAHMPAAASPLPEPLAGAAPGRPLVLGLRSPTGAAAATTDAVVGVLRCQRFLSCARNKLWWMTPEWGTEAAQLPGETQFLLVELAEGGPYGLLLPLISDDTFRATLRPAAPAAARGGVLGGLLGGLTGNGSNR